MTGSAFKDKMELVFRYQVQVDTHENVDDDGKGKI